MTIMYRTDPASAVPDVLAHVPLMTFAMHSERLGYPTSCWSITMTPNVTRPRSRGRVSLASADPADPPLIDYRWFTDADGHDERALLAGLGWRAASRRGPRWPTGSRGGFPGPGVEADEELSALARATCHTVYHVSGTARMGAPDDPAAVLDPRLRVRGVDRLRVIDASAFPALTTVNPVVAVLMLAEAGAGLVRGDAG